MLPTAKNARIFRAPFIMRATKTGWNVLVTKAISRSKPGKCCKGRRRALCLASYSNGEAAISSRWGWTHEQKVEKCQSKIRLLESKD
jgi:hypothetical protein